MSHRFPSVLVLGIVCLLLAPVAQADFIPSAFPPGGVHLNPFIPGALGGGPPPGAFLAAACGTPGELVPAFTLGAPWGAVCGIGDGLVSPAGWLWEVQIDLDPLIPLGPAVFVSFFGGAPVLVPLGGGWDITLGIFQMDLAGAGPGAGGFCTFGGLEIGAVCKQLLNLTPFPVGHGVSVIEDPAIVPPLVPRKVITLNFSTDQPTTVFEGTAHNGISISGDGTIGFSINEFNVPEPGTLALLGSGLLALAWRKRSFRTIHHK